MTEEQTIKKEVFEHRKTLIAFVMKLAEKLNKKGDIVSEETTSYFKVEDLVVQGDELKAIYYNCEDVATKSIVISYEYKETYVSNVCYTEDDIVKTLTDIRDALTKRE